jgi:hypothetical protein
VYSDDIWQDLWAQNESQVFRHYHPMPITNPAYMKMLKANASDILFKPEFFESRPCGVIGKPIRTPKPVLQFKDGLVEPGFNIGTRTNGVDKAMWPQDLMTEVLK